MTEKSKIRSNVKYPIFYTLSVDKYHDFLIEEQKSAVWCAHSYGRKSGKKFASKNLGDVIRIWRVK